MTWRQRELFTFRDVLNRYPEYNEQIKALNLSDDEMKIADFLYYNAEKYVRYYTSNGAQVHLNSSYDELIDRAIQCSPKVREAFLKLNGSHGFIGYADSQAAYLLVDDYINRNFCDKKTDRVSRGGK